MFLKVTEHHKPISGALIGPPAHPALREAVNAVRRGWAVIPVFAPSGNGRCSCDSGDGCRFAAKHPLTEHGYRSASAEEQQVLEWAYQWPDCNWGVVSSASSLLILDVDPRNEGDATLRRLQREHGDLPDTWTVKSGGGGQHLYFRRPLGLPLQDCDLGLGLEVKLLQYVLLPGSRHASGGRYEWEIGSDPDELPLADPPVWLTGQVRRQGQEMHGLEVPERLKGFSIRQCSDLDEARLEAHIEPGTRLWKIFHGQGDYDHGDPSRLDQALFRELFCLGYDIWDAQPVMARLRQLRRAWVYKAFRRDYVLRTWKYAEKLGPPTSRPSPVLEYQRLEAIQTIHQLMPEILKWGDHVHISALMVLVMHMDPDKECFMSQTRMGAQLSRDPSTGRRVLDALERHGLITRKSVPGGKRRGFAAAYRLSFLEKDRREEGITQGAPGGLNTPV